MSEKSAPLLGQIDDVLDVLVAHAASVRVAAALGVAQDGQHAVGIPQAEGWVEHLVKQRLGLACKGVQGDRQRRNEMPQLCWTGSKPLIGTVKSYAVQMLRA